jgi:hypothetical protein
MDPQQVGILDLLAMYRRVREALTKGDLSTLAVIAGDLLHAAAPLLPKGGKVPPAPALPPDLQPLTMPSIGGIVGAVDSIFSAWQILKQLFGNR